MIWLHPARRLVGKILYKHLPPPLTNRRVFFSIAERSKGNDCHLSPIAARLRERKIIELWMKQPPAEPSISQPDRLAYGPFTFNIHAAPWASCTVEASTNLRDWRPIAHGEIGDKPMGYVDSVAPNFGHRFYRVVAGNLTSKQIIGYTSLILPPGFSMIANQLVSEAVSVQELFKGCPSGTRLSKYQPHLYQFGNNTFNEGAWTNPQESLGFGECAIFFNPTTDYKFHAFVGEVRQGQLSIPIPSGFSIRCSLLPLPGDLGELGFPSGDGDVIHLFDRDRQAYIEHTFSSGKWQPELPPIAVAESFWIAKSKAANWTITHSALPPDLPPGHRPQ